MYSILFWTVQYSTILDAYTQSSTTCITQARSQFRSLFPPQSHPCFCHSYILWSSKSVVNQNYHTFLTNVFPTSVRTWTDNKSIRLLVAQGRLCQPGVPECACLYVSMHGTTQMRLERIQINSTIPSKSDSISDSQQFYQKRTPLELCTCIVIVLSSCERTRHNWVPHHDGKTPPHKMEESLVSLYYPQKDCWRRPFWNDNSSCV